MKRVAIVQARMTSTRHPGKVLMDVAGKPMLARHLDRLRKCKRIDAILVATTLNVSDDPVVSLVRSMGIACSRGSEEDVLSRYAQAAREAKADIIVRTTADCPFLDPGVTDQIVSRLGPDSDYVSNTLERTYPMGLDAEAFTRKALERAHQEAREPYQREHVTPYIWEDGRRFRLDCVKNNLDCSGYRLTVDTVEDLRLAQELYERVFRTVGEGFCWQDLVRLMQQDPSLPAINASVRQKPLV